MHKINVLTIGSKNFNTSLEELKDYLSFKLTTCNDILETKSLDKYDVLLIHEDYLINRASIKFLENCNKIKILIYSSNKSNSISFTDELLLPSTVKEINEIIENSIVKKKFTKNSTIQIKDYILDKNEKKLIKNKTSILLTEKEIQLLELLLKNNEAISKNKILEVVWRYAADADTHTVETHIYRLRKKIENKFSDENFIINNKAGYLI